MAKQIENTKTAELIPMPKKRGRPATGQAMTAAERKRAQRERDKLRFYEDPELWTEATCMALLADKTLSPETYKAAFTMLMHRRGHGLGGWFR